MRILLPLLLLLSAPILASCAARPLTDTEKTFSHQIFGDSINTAKIRFHDGAVVEKITYKRKKRPRLACREKIWPEPEEKIVTVGPAAIAIYNRIFYTKPFYLNNYLHKYPDRMHLYAAMLFAHELTHIWQWQNRARTGYSPLRAAREHAVSDDPYLFDIKTKTRFLDYGFEQQASIVEEYICCHTLDPHAPRTKRLESLIKQAMPMQNLRIPARIGLPWKGARTKGICR